MMHKVKVLRFECSHLNISEMDDVYSDSFVFYPATSDWDEVDDDMLERLRTAVYQANNGNNNYVLVLYSETTQSEMFKDAKAFIDAQEKIKAKIVADALARKIKSEASATEKKRKQLERLKKELGEE